jgi:hypothetical protein
MNAAGTAGPSAGRRGSLPLPGGHGHERPLHLSPDFMHNHGPRRLGLHEPRTPQLATGEPC